MKQLLKSLFVFAFCIAGESAFSQKLQKLWESDSVFKVPESVLHDAKNKMLYVSNIDGANPWEKDGKGSIGIMSEDGKNIVAEWVVGLDAPKGMGLYKGKLYVANLTEIAVIDINKAAIVKRIPIAGSVGLNDISIDKNGVIYVTDSKAKTLYKVVKGKPELLLENLNGPNGVLVKGNNIYLLDAGSFNKVETDKTLTKYADGMEGVTDGIEQVKENEFIISCWAGAIWYVKKDGTKTLLLDTREEKKNTADIGYDPKTKTVFVPTFWRNTVVAYKIN
jgi:DNA-binding beta-propeller fold protein YncE